MEMDLKTEAGFTNACAWIRGHLARMEEGGVWVIPRSGCVVRVTSHTDKTVVIRGAAMEPGVVGIMTTLGWKITKEYL